eukprot:TRINITY_DN1532_c0_g1_i1.p1 TRINITY_DN1532_c0_g1~~TRINITY_DN1532_c0_g1_i1.p1  ORF type:complete len:181 (+),score=20.97 TRINITY_DN1532_c0_g1_i1:139-681(+)
MWTRAPGFPIFKCHQGCHLKKGDIHLNKDDGIHIPFLDHNDVDYIPGTVLTQINNLLELPQKSKYSRIKTEGSSIDRRNVPQLLNFLFKLNNTEELEQYIHQLTLRPDLNGSIYMYWPGLICKLSYPHFSYFIEDSGYQNKYDFTVPEHFKSGCLAVKHIILNDLHPKKPVPNKKWKSSL